MTGGRGRGSGSGSGSGRGSKLPPQPTPPKGDPPGHKDDDPNTGDSASEDDNNYTPPKDLLDGTTQQRRPFDTPPDLSPPRQGIPAPFNNPPIATTHTSGITDCRNRSKPSPAEEKPKLVVPDEASLEGEAQHPPHQGPTPVFLIFIVLLVLVGIYSLHLALVKAQEEQRSKREPKLIADVYADLKLELQGLSQEFSQPREVWLSLLGQLEAVMVEEPQQPAILLLAVPDDSKGVAVCLAQRLARAIQYAFEDTRFVMFDTRSSQHRGASESLKVELDDTLRALAQVHAAVVHNVESIPGAAAMILHAYCDNDNAPYKQAVIFLLAEIPGKYGDLGGRYTRLDSVVDSHLSRLWGAELAEKDVSALVSRTCNTPILIRPERPGRVLELCPL